VDRQQADDHQDNKYRADNNVEPAKLFMHERKTPQDTAWITAVTILLLSPMMFTLSEREKVIPRHKRDGESLSRSG
jgi:hypothetical protein